jgi:integrase
MSRLVPKYRQRSDGVAFVEHRSIANKSRRMTLGKYGSPESLQRYRNFLARLEGQQTSLVASPSNWPTLEELIDAYLTFAEGFYLRETGLSSEYDGMVHALGFLTPFSDMTAEQFGPKSLVAVRLALAKGGKLRSTANHVLSRIKKFFRWCSENELAPPELYHKLLCVRGLVRGQDGCKEAQPIGPAPEASLRGVLPFVSKPVAAMAQIQHRCGMRPGEVCVMRAPDIDMTGDIWIYQPHRHKVQHRDLSQVKAIPRSVQPILEPFLLNAPYLFYPGRKRERYETETYRRSLAYGFKKAKKAGIELVSFTPNQLRHAILTEVNQELGPDAAKLWAWHENVSTTEIYLTKQISELVKVARQLDARWSASA